MGYVQYAWNSSFKNAMQSWYCYLFTHNAPAPDWPGSKRRVSGHLSFSLQTCHSKHFLTSSAVEQDEKVASHCFRLNRACFQGQGHTPSKSKFTRSRFNSCSYVLENRQHLEAPSRCWARCMAGGINTAPCTSNEELPVKHHAHSMLVRIRCVEDRLTIW